MYGLLTGLVAVLSFARSAAFFEATLAAATRIHDAMVERVLRAPLAFFHTNPAGRVLNRCACAAGAGRDVAAPGPCLCRLRGYVMRAAARPDSLVGTSYLAG